MPLAVKELQNIILPVVLYRCKTWSLALREEHRLRVFENRIIRRMCGTKRHEVTGEWKKLPMRGFLICAHPKMSLGISSQGR
jgi:hypothetical protein